MTKRALFIISILFTLVSCKKEEEYVSFIVAMENSHFDTSHATLRGVIVAPGKVNISECMFIIYNPFAPQGEYSNISLGKITKPGKIEVEIDTLKMGQEYRYYLYVESQGKAFSTPVDTVVTTFGGGGK